MRKRRWTSASNGPPATVIVAGFMASLIGSLWVLLSLGPSVSNQKSSQATTLATARAPRYAYVFYVADDAYGCGALVNMARLREAEGGLPDNVDLVMVAKDGAVSESILEKAEHELGGIVYPTSSFGEGADFIAPVGGLSGYYNDCFLKFRAFLLPPDVYQRLILIDTDSLIIRPPHHLFRLPDELPLAAPSAYWLRPTYVSVTNWFLSVRPSKEIYETLQRRLKELQSQGQKDVYDMDLFNIVFEKDITVLPPIYGMLDSELVENDHEHLGPLDLMLNTSGWAVHFSGGPKPILTKVDPAQIPNTHPKAHPGYAKIMEMWGDTARRICPPETLP